MYKSIQTYENNEWTNTEFHTQDEFKEYILNIFKVPGEYGFNELAYEFNKQAQIFNKQGFYCNKPFRSKDFNTYWETEKDKCRNGVIYTYL